MSKYKILEVMVCNSNDEFVRRYWSSTPEKKVYELWEFREFKILSYKFDSWELVNCYDTLDEAKDKILELKGEHPDQLKRKELQKEQPKVVYEE